MKIIWLGYLVYSLDNYAMKRCIETGLTVVRWEIQFTVNESSCTYIRPNWQLHVVFQMQKLTSLIKLIRNG